MQLSLLKKIKWLNTTNHKDIGLHETNKIKELDNFIENPTKYLYEYESKNNINIDFDEYALVDKLPEE